MSAAFCNSLRAINRIRGGNVPFEASKLTNSVTVDLDCHAIFSLSFGEGV